MRIVYTSDLHGSDTLYQQLAALLADARPQLLILGGDMLPDGEPPHRARSQRDYLRNTLIPRIECWQRDFPSLEVALQMGNHDWRSTEHEARRLAQTARWHLLPTGAVLTLHGINFLSLCHVPPTPHDAKDYERRDLPADQPADGPASISDPETADLAEIRCAAFFQQQPALSEILAQCAVPPQPWIFVAHAPPYDTLLDRLPELDFPVGSKAVRAFIETHRPLCALHGHIHESPEVTGEIRDHVAGVPCINPGQSHTKLRAVLLDTADPANSLTLHTAP